MAHIAKCNNQEAKKKQAKTFIKTFQLNEGEGMIIAKGAVADSRVLNLGVKYANESAKKKHRMLVAQVIEGKK